MILRLQLISTGQFFAMDDSGSLTIEINSTLFNDADDFLGSFSYTGSMPLEDNARLIGNAQYIATPVSLRSLAVRVWLDNLPWKTARFVFNMENGSIQYNLLIDKGEIAKQMAAIKLHEITGDDDFSFSGDPTTFPAFMLATAQAAPGTYPVVFFPVKNDGAYNVIPDDEQGDYPVGFPQNTIMNDWRLVSTDGAFLVDTAAAVAGNYMTNTQLPFYYLVYVIKQSMKHFGLKAVGSWLDDPDTLRLVIETRITINNFSLSGYQFYMPDILYSDFLKAIRNEYGLVIEFDVANKLVYFESLKYLEDSADVINLSGKQLNSFKELPIQITGYTISRPVDDTDTAFTDDEKNTLPKLIIGDGSTEIALISVATKMVNELSSASFTQGLWRIPYIKQPVANLGLQGSIGSIDWGNGSWDDARAFKLRFLYYHGMKPDAVGYNYPYGSSDNLNQGGFPISLFTLALNPPDGSFLPIKHKYDFLNNSKPFEMDFHLSKQEFINLRARSRIVLRDFNNAPISALLSKIAADFEDTIKTKLTVYPVIRPNNQATIVPLDTTPPPGVDNGVIYAQIEGRNQTQTGSPSHPGTGGGIRYFCDVYVKFYADAAKVATKSANQLPIRYQVGQTPRNGSGKVVVVECTGTELLLVSNAPTSIANLKNTYFLLVNSTYNIIPTP